MVSAPRNAHAGNSDTFYMGTDATLLAGAVTAASKGATALWYNPSGLAAERSASVDASLNAYLLRFGGTPDLTVDRASGGEQQKLSSLDLSPVPTALSYTRRLGGWQIGAGLFVPNRAVAYPRTKVSVTSAGNAATVGQDGNDHFSEYYGGLGIGRTVAPGFRVGGGLFVYYSSRVETDLVYVEASSASEGVGAFFLSHQTFDEIRIGYQLVWGFQWELHPRWQVGATFRSPVFQAYEIAQSVSATAGAVGQDAQGDLTFQENVGLKGSLLRPMRVHFGVRYRGDAWELAVDGNVQAPYDETTNRDGPSRTVGNVRVGASFRLTPTLSLGGGAFTDLSPYDAASSPRRASLDFYGLSLGLHTRSVFSVRSSGTTEDKSLVMSSAFGISYALGSGTLNNVELSSQSGDFNAQVRFDPVTAHEFTFYLGSTLDM